MTNKPIPSQHAPHWVVVYVALGISEAYLIANRLKSEGIVAFVDQEPAAGALGINIGLGEIRVLVHESDYDAALLILEPDEPDQLPSERDYIILDDDEEIE
ncbi:MAG: DUF2007 domain-containing protein [Chloroflexi bacterium]|nr:DUF2007 domain-containing protein [Chloroflexota bacterium]